MPLGNPADEKVFGVRIFDEGLVAARNPTGLGVTAPMTEVIGIYGLSTDAMQPHSNC